MTDKLKELLHEAYSLLRMVYLDENVTDERCKRVEQILNSFDPDSGIVAGQSPAEILTAKGVSNQPLGSEFAAVLSDNWQDLIMISGEDK